MYTVKSQQAQRARANTAWIFYENGETRFSTKAQN